MAAPSEAAVHIRSLVLLAGIVAAMGCGSQQAAGPSPVAPSAPVGPTPVNFAGDWTVTAIQTVCTPASRYTCPRAPVVAVPHSLRLAQLGTHVTGMLNGIDVSGDVADGRLRLTGRGAIPDYGGTFDVTSFDVVQTADGSLDGRFVNDWWIPENFEPLGGPHHSEHTVLGAVRGALPSSFAGRWVGNFQTQGCVGPRCAGPEKEFELRIDEVGGMLSGTLALQLNLQVPVLGTATGTSADLTSATNALTRPPFRLTAMQLQRSATGRLTGMFTIERVPGRMEQLELVQVSLVAIE